MFPSTAALVIWLRAFKHLSCSMERSTPREALTLASLTSSRAFSSSCTWDTITLNATLSRTDWEGTMQNVAFLISITFILSRKINIRKSNYLYSSLILVSRYLNDVVIQHHDTIVTSSDLGLAVTCQYDLTNKTVANEVDLGITGDIQTSMTEDVIVDSPNVAMRITDRSGDDIIASAEVGDPLVSCHYYSNKPLSVFI